MKQVIAFFALLAVLTLASGAAQTRSDVSELVPVQALAVDVQDGRVRVTADTGDEGFGRSLDDALSDLRAGCAGRLFTQTAEHILMTQRAWYLLPQVCVSGQLRPAAKLYRAGEKAARPEEALAFLQAHPGPLTLSRARAALLENKMPEAPVLLEAEGGFRLGR